MSDETAKETTDDRAPKQTTAMYLIEENLLQVAIDTLAELPYKTVGELVNKLRSCKRHEG